MEKKIAVIRGDGIGPEIMTQALAVLDAVAEKFGHTFPARYIYLFSYWFVVYFNS